MERFVGTIPEGVEGPKEGLGECGARGQVGGKRRYFQIVHLPIDTSKGGGGKVGEKSAICYFDVVPIFAS